MLREPKRTVRLSSLMSVIGVDDPEKIAQGHCPCCDCAVEVWVTGNGIELSTHDNLKDRGRNEAEAHSSFQSWNGFQRMLKTIIRMIK